MADVVIQPITPDRFDDVAEVFGTRGAPSWCWCQYFFTTGSDYTMSAQHNRAALRSQIASATSPVGLVAHVAADAPGEPLGPAVGWVQLGPRTTFPRITTNREMKRLVHDLDDDLDDESVWAVTCFVVKVGHRRKGIGGALLDAAVAAARDAGARAVVGHPVDVAARTSRVGGSDLYHGAASTFERSGFREVGRTGATRPVMRLDL